MSSANLPWPPLDFSLLLPILAGQPSTASLPPAVAQAIPTCASTCVQSFIADEFPTSICASPQDLDCLCTKNSKFGFTLGEGSLRCVITACSDLGVPLSPQQELQAYSVCTGIANAKPMTHGTLTATIPSSPTPTDSIPIPTSSSRRTSSSSIQSSKNTYSFRSPTRSSTLMTSTTVSTIRPTSSSTSRSTTSRLSTSSSVSSLPSTTTDSITITSTSLPSSSSASATQTPILTGAGSAPALSKAEIAGIAIGASFAALAFFVIIFLIYRYRRRRSNRRDSGSTIGGVGIFSGLPSSPGIYRRVDPEFEQNNRSRDFTQLESQGGNTTPVTANRNPTGIWRNNAEPEIGVASEMTPKPEMAESPMSFQSSRTSRLLPDNPLSSLRPAPLRIGHPVSPESPGGSVVLGAAGIGQRGAMPLSKAAPRGRISSNTSQVSLQPDWSDRHPSASDPFLGSRYDPSPAHPEVLTYGVPNPDVLNHGQWTQSLDNLRKPVPARQSSSARSLTRQQAAKASISPSDYTGRQMFDFPPQPVYIPRKPVPRRKSAPKRPVTHYSSASDTSFEDAGDEDTVPTANPILSPVAESPAMRSDRRPVTSPKPTTYLSSPSERRPEPESPTRKPTRRKQLAAAAGPPKSSLKPLPKVPEIPDSSTPLIPQTRGDQFSAPIPTDARGSPRERTAKWKILVGPGYQPLVNPGTPRSVRSSPSTPTRREA
ncbi:hypothetical protein MMC29_007064 [Sticta canariensis]|nr:hypothetical protein [Sticta canariensis]